MTESEALEKIRIAKSKRQIGTEIADVIIKALEKQIEMKKYCDENTCVNCPYSNPLSDDSKCMNDFIIELG